MQLKRDTAALTVTLGAMTCLGPLATDMYLPSFPAIAAHFAAGEAAVQATLSAYLVGFALGQVVYGPLSDTYGRRPVLLTGFALFAAASLLCTLAGSVPTLVAARALQALGAAGPITLARAIVRDLYRGARAGKELSRMGAITGLAPALAPAIGAALQAVAGWRTSFFLCCLYAVAAAVVVAVMLPETLPRKRPEPLNLVTVIASFGTLLKDPGYRVYVALLSFAYAGIFAYLSASSFILQGRYGLDQMQFALVFSLGAAAYVAGTGSASRIVSWRGLLGTIAIGVALLLLGGVLQFTAMLAWPSRVSGVMAPMMIYLFGIGLVMPQAMAAAMEPFPDRAGAASALAGVIQMGLAALCGLAIGQMLPVSVMVLPAATLAMGAFSFAAFHLARHAKAI